MSNNEKLTKTITLSGYTPAGYQVSIAYEANDIPSAASVDAKMQALGLLPHVGSAAPEPATKTEIMTHVARRDQHNDDGSITPHIAFYAKNPKLIHRYLHVYMDNSVDLIAFERHCGLRLVDIPLYEADSHPSRDLRRNKRHIVALPQPVTIEYTEETFVADDGSEGTRKRFVRYVSPPAPEPESSEDKNPTLEDKINDFKQLGNQLGEQAQVNLQQRTGRVQISPFEVPDIAKGSMPGRDDQRGKVTRLRVHGSDLEVGDIIRREVNSRTFEKEMWTIIAIGEKDLDNKCRREATVLVDGKEHRVVSLNAGTGAPLSYHLVVGGPKLDAIADDPTLYEIINNVGATWRGSAASQRQPKAS